MERALESLLVPRVSPKSLAAQSLLYLHGFSAHSSMVNPRDLANKYFSFAVTACNKAISSSFSYNSMLKFSCGPRVVQDNFSLYILLDEEALDSEKYFSSNGLVCMFYGLWAWLVDVLKCISKTWKPLSREALNIYPMARGFFTVIGEKKATCEVGRWFWGSTSLSMQRSCSPFDPVTK